jgi:hypothetical protein
MHMRSTRRPAGRLGVAFADNHALESLALTMTPARSPVDN